MSDSLISATREELERFLSRPEIRSVAQQAGEMGLTRDELPATLDATVKTPAVFERWSGPHEPESESLLAQWILAHVALRSLDRIADLPVVPEVRQLILRRYQMIAKTASGGALFSPRSREFREIAEIVLLRRFIAGQLHWKISGIPRSWPLRMKWRDALRTIGTVSRMGGWTPCFEAHIPSRGSPLLIESEYKRCYLRMAGSMELQPGIRGIIGSSWLHAEETMRVSPHLSWINRLFLDNGGLLVHMGLASTDSGFLVGSQQRRQLYESGAYRPRYAMFIWPRTPFLNWARQMSNPS